MHDIAEVEKLMIAAGITELEFRSGTIQLSLRTGSSEPGLPGRVHAEGAPVSISVQRHFELRSQHVGNFQHRHPTRKQAVIAAGAEVAAGETMGFVRDGLVLYPVVAPQPGIVTRVTSPDGAPVGYGAVLFELEVTESP